MLAFRRELPQRRKSSHRRLHCLSRLGYHRRIRFRSAGTSSVWFLLLWLRALGFFLELVLLLSLGFVCDVFWSPSWLCLSVASTCSPLLFGPFYCQIWLEKYVQFLPTPYLSFCCWLLSCPCVPKYPYAPWLVLLNMIPLQFPNYPPCYPFCPPALTPLWCKWLCQCVHIHCDVTMPLICSRCELSMLSRPFLAKGLT